MDTEFQYANQNGNVRFDLVWVDVGMRKLYVIELKTIGDSRLYFSENSRDSEGSDKIDGQLRKYREFIRDQNQNLIDHYERVLLIKRKLGILPMGLQELYSLDGFNFEERPILLIGDCTQAWINENKTRMDSSINHIAYGCFYQGKNTRGFYVPKKTTGNKHIF